MLWYITTYILFQDYLVNQIKEKMLMAVWLLMFAFWFNLLLKEADGGKFL